MTISTRWWWGRLAQVALGLAVLLLASGASNASETAGDNARLRVVSWNLEDIWEDSDAALRPGARIWSDAEIRRLSNRLTAIDADVLLIQGAGSLRALRRLFPARTHQVVFSRELATRLVGAAAETGAEPVRDGYTAVVLRRSRALRLRRQEHVRAFGENGGRRGDVALGRHATPGAAATAIELQVAGRKVWLMSVDLARHCEPSTPASVGGGSGEAPCVASRWQTDVLDAWMALRDEQDAPYLVAGRLAATDPRAAEGTRAVSDDETAGHHPFWGRLDRDEEVVAADTVAQASRIEAQEAMAPARPVDPLAAPAAPRVARVTLEPPRAPSRAPNEPFVVLPTHEGDAERDDTFGGLVSRAFVALIESLFGNGSQAAPGDASREPTQAQPVEASLPASPSVAPGPENAPAEIGSAVDTTQDDSDAAADVRSRWSAPWWMAQSLRFLSLGPGADGGCRDANDAGWTGDAMLVGEPLGAVARLSRQASVEPGLAIAGRQLPCPVVLDIVLRPEDG